MEFQIRGRIGHSIVLGVLLILLIMLLLVLGHVFFVRLIATSIVGTLDRGRVSQCLKLKEKFQVFLFGMSATKLVWKKNRGFHSPPSLSSMNLLMVSWFRKVISGPGCSLRSRAMSATILSTSILTVPFAFWL